MSTRRLGTAKHLRQMPILSTTSIQSTVTPAPRFILFCKPPHRLQDSAPCELVCKAALKSQDWTVQDWKMTDEFCPLQTQQATKAYSHPNINASEQFICFQHSSMKLLTLHLWRCCYSTIQNFLSHHKTTVHLFLAAIRLRTLVSYDSRGRVISQRQNSTF